MPAIISRRCPRLTGIIVVALLVVGCGGQKAPSTAASSPTTSTASATTAAATTTTAVSTTAEEEAWLKALTKLHTKIDKVLADAPSNMTSSTMGTLSAKMRGCSRDLARLGSPPDRLQPVYKLAKSGCVQYDKAAKCFATAASIGAPLAGTSQERTFNQALECGFSVPAKGSALLTDAEAKGFEIENMPG